MEGIILGLEALASPWSLIGGVSLLAIVVRALGFGYIEERRKPAAGCSGWTGRSPALRRPLLRRRRSGSRLDNIHGTGRGAGTSRFPGQLNPGPQSTEDTSPYTFPTALRVSRVCPPHTIEVAFLSHSLFIFLRRGNFLW